MNRSFTGGCACRAVRYTIAAEPLAMFDCQCRQCQRESGTGHSSYLAFPAEAVDRSGDAGQWRVRGDGGTLKEAAFCRRCGCPVYMTFPDMPDTFLVRAGSLDNPELFTPQFVTWAEAGHAWDVYPEGMTRFDRMPPN